MKFLPFIMLSTLCTANCLADQAASRVPSDSVVKLTSLIKENVVTVSTTPKVAPDNEVIPLWPGVAPGLKDGPDEEKDTTKPDANGKPSDGIIRLGNVSKPTITLYRPAKEKDTGTAVVVCPGGGYSILAMNLEGSEVCEWLTSIGVTGILLKYRVPGRSGAIQDAQRALGIVRHRAKEWGIDPKRIGILGFSAGGHLSASASTYFETRAYPMVDEADKESCRPDFTVLIYPAYLTQDKDLTQLAPEMKVTGNTPPTFLAMTEDDPVHVENVFMYALALKSAKVPFELHVYPKGGHGYGLRPSPNAISHWPQHVEGWLHTQGWLKAKS